MLDLHEKSSCRKHHETMKAPICGHLPHKRNGPRAGIRCGKPATRAFLRPGMPPAFRCEEHRKLLVIGTPVWRAAFFEVSIKDAMNLMTVDEVQSS
jgi:hypothetical protein